MATSGLWFPINMGNGILQAPQKSWEWQASEKHIMGCDMY
jgi:hypothetical protein